MKKRIFALLLCCAVSIITPAAAEEQTLSVQEQGETVIEDFLMEDDEEIIAVEGSISSAEETVITEEEMPEEILGDEEADLIEEEQPLEEVEEASETEVNEEEAEEAGAEEAEEAEAEEADLVGASQKLPAPVITGVYNSQKGADLYWNKVDGATGYIIYRFRAAEKTIKIAEVNSSVTHIYDESVKNNCWGRVYHYYVVGVKNGSAGHWSKPAVLQRVASLNISSLTSSSNSVKIAWNCVTENKANGYQVQYAESTSDLYNRTGTFRYKTISGRKNTNTTITGLTTGRAYVFRVRAYVDYTNTGTGAKTRTWSQYSSVKDKTVENNAPRTYKDIYREFLAKGSIPAQNGNYTYTYTLSSFLLLDVNKDGIPELFVKNVPAEKTMCTIRVYSIKNNNLFFCGEHGTKTQASVKYNPVYKGVLDEWWTNGVGGAGSVMYGVSLAEEGKGLVELYIAWEGNEDTSPNAKRVYQIGPDRKLTTEAVYKAYVQKYFNLNEYVVYKYAANTEANRANI